MTHRIYRMNDEAWNNGTNWDTAIYNEQIETVKEFDDYNEALVYYEENFDPNDERYGVE